MPPRGFPGQTLSGRGNAKVVYDLREARALLRAAQGRTTPIAAAKHEACRTLLEELASLAQSLDVHIEARPFVRGAPLSLAVGLPGRGLVRLREDGGRLIARKEAGPHKVGPDVEIALDFDPIAVRFVGREHDEFLVPVPGEPWPLRSPLAVVVEIVLELLESPAT